MDPNRLPHRLFADKEEPVGDRVNSYFILTALKVVLKALQPDELDAIRPAFGRLLDVYSKPAFSGKLCHFLLTRQLDVSKRHEIWVVFGGKPIRFSLREFGIVTGLNCSPIPVLDPNLVKAAPGVAPYWFTLFGGEENVTAETLTRDLKKSSSLSRERRIKYACLLLVHGLLCRRSFNMKIPKEHVELLRDLPNFLNFPWGRYAFQLTMQSIKSRTVNQLAQSTVAIQGFIHALQLVVLAAVPAAACAFGDGTDLESADEGNPSVCSLKLDKLWEVEEDENVEVTPIIPSICAADEAVDLSWPDEVTDYNVEHLELLIRQGTQFSRSMFTGGRRGYAVTQSDVAIVKSKRKRRREIKSSPQGKSKSSENGNSKDAPAQTNVSKVSNKRRRPKIVSPSKCDKGHETTNSGYVDLKALLLESQAELYAHLKCDLKDMEARFESNIKHSVPIYVGEWLQAKSVIDGVVKDVANGPGASPLAKAPIPSPKAKTRKLIVSESESSSAEESFHEDGSAGSEEEESGEEAEEDEAEEDEAEEADGSEDEHPSESESTGSEAYSAPTAAASPTATTRPNGSTTPDATPMVPEAPTTKEFPKEVISTTNKKFKAIVDTAVKNKVLCLGPGLNVSYQDIVNLPVSIPPNRPQVMDCCVLVLRESLFSPLDISLHPRVDVLPCGFFVSLAKSFAKFKALSRKDKFCFDAALIRSMRARFKKFGKVWVKDVDFLYFPFNLDRNRWVGVMLNLLSSTLTVFDSTADVSRATRLKPDFDFICDMLPHLIRKASVDDSMKVFSSRPFSFVRDATVVQASSSSKSGILSLLFIKAHASGGMSSVYSVDESCITEFAEQLAVDVVEYCFG